MAYDGELKEACGNCRFFHFANFPDQNVGECWRYPPVIVDALVKEFYEVTDHDSFETIETASRHPYTDADSLCGEYQPTAEFCDKKYGSVKASVPVETTQSPATDAGRSPSSDPSLPRPPA